MRIWEHTLKDLTGDLRPFPDVPAPEIPMPFVLKSVVPITDQPGYATAMVQGSSLSN
jgi:hypothetical protein